MNPQTTGGIATHTAAERGRGEAHEQSMSDCVCLHVCEQGPCMCAQILLARPGPGAY